MKYKLNSSIESKTNIKSRLKTKNTWWKISESIDGGGVKDKELLKNDLQLNSCFKKGWI